MTRSVYLHVLYYRVVYSDVGLLRNNRGSHCSHDLFASQLPCCQTKVVQSPSQFVDGSTCVPVEHHNIVICANLCVITDMVHTVTTKIYTCKMCAGCNDMY